TCFKETPEISGDDDEVLVRPEFCVPEKTAVQVAPASSPGEGTRGDSGPSKTAGMTPPPAGEKAKDHYSEITLSLGVSPGQFSDLVRVLRYLQGRFRECTVDVFIRASQGELKATEYEDKIKESLTQAGIQVKDEYCG
ncbi:MAG: hypothetical protein ACP5Q4_10255, partial [Candidatus Caldatribacteriaceae bacterium]